MQEDDTNNEKNKKTENNIDEPASLSSLIKWNILKALEKNPFIDLKCAIKAAQDRIETDVESMVNQFPEERHLACALLAWQQLGHSGATSLYKFVEDNHIEEDCTCKNIKQNEQEHGKEINRLDFTSKKEEKFEPKGLSCTSKTKGKIKYGVMDKSLKLSSSDVSRGLETFSKGPVVRLPAGTKIIMRLDSTHQNPRKKQKGQNKDTLSKIDAACCMDSECVERLQLLDAATSELRVRANKLAKREAERVELLERAETAWKDLELGYQRRLALAEEKEEDMSKEIQKLIEERNAYKNACTGLVQDLKNRGDAAESDKNKLIDIEKHVCDHACVKLRLSEECARAEAALAEQQCKAAQLDRDLQFKEEQTRRKKSALESEQESARALSIEVERTMRAELSALREQIKNVSKDLLVEDAENGRIKEELEKLRQEKMEIVEDLDGCKESCDARLQGRLDELKKKRDQLMELKDQVMECRCKLPVDEVVEVKRTPSLAALCRCTPDDKLVDSCSCTSLRERLLSNLLADLFAGLQTELGGNGAQMPCQLLKCLEDKHNWDRASVIKTNLRNFFSTLLIGELDIAIATSIEKYHAKWVGASCADDLKRLSRIDVQNVGWEERAIERKAQKLATTLAEQLFQERAEQLAERAKEIVKAGPPPCECKPAQAVFPCLVQTTMLHGTEAAVPILINTPNAGTTGHRNQGAKAAAVNPTNVTTAGNIGHLKRNGEAAYVNSTNVTTAGNTGHLKRNGVAAVVNSTNVTTAGNTGHLKRNGVAAVVNSTNVTTAGNTGHLKRHGEAAVVNSTNVTTAGNTGYSKRNGEATVGNSTNITTVGNIGHLKRSGGAGGVNYTNVTNTGNSGLWKRTQMDVTQLRLQIEALKKDSINKEDLKLMEENITKIFQQLSGAEYIERVTDTINNRDLENISENRKKEKNADQYRYFSQNKLRNIRKKTSEMSNWKRVTKSSLSQSHFNEKNSRQYKRFSPAYAVNLCLCEPQKESVAKLQQSKVDVDVVINNSSIITWKQKLSKESMSQLSCIKHTKPINKSFRSPKIDISSSKSSAQPYCPSDCICFHKKPSNTSIDKLLETLTKWKCDLAGIEDKSTMKTNSSQDKEKDKIQYENSMSDRNKLILNDDSNIGDTQIEDTGCSKLAHRIPPTTESEYIGTINLEKSSERVCNCIKKSSNIKSSNVFMCINSDACDCKTSIEIEPEQNKRIRENEPLPILNSIQDIDSKNNYTSVVDKIEKPDIQADNKSVKNENQISKHTDLFPCDYYVKFLGVTLTSANSLEQSRNQKINDDSDRSPSIVQRTRNQGKNNVRRSNAMHSPENISSKNMYNQNDKTTKKTYPGPSSDIFANKYEENNINKSNVTDIKRLKDSEQICVCCNNANMDDSKDLEVNVFHLLEEHLKGKLEEFKSISCESSCIPSHEEEKIFADIMQKVKQVISDCANEMKCKCTGDNPSHDGSWKRAYGLLQEYLKIKIQRVQCLCVSLNDNKNVAFTNILDKVCNLIEHDFERLKEICTCKNHNGIHKHVQIENKVKQIEEMPEKDMNMHTSEYETVLNKINPLTEKLSKYNSLKSMMYTQHTSSQVPPDLGMATKSCDAMSIKTKNIQTTDTDSLVPYGYGSPVEVTKIDCDCYCNTINQDIGPVLELFGTKDGAMEELKYIKHYEQNFQDTKNDAAKIDVDNKSSPKLPYIGCTVDCTCDHTLGSCICMKSVIQTDNNAIKKIWNKFMSENRNQKQDLSYIMNNTQNNIVCNNPVTFNTSVLAVTENDNQCETEMNTSREDLVLLDSKDNVPTTHHTTNTLEENVSLGTDYSTDWFESPQSFKPDIISSKDMLKHSIYFPLSTDSNNSKRYKSETQVQPGKSLQICDCDVVPICHVKMLVENIENNLVNSKCTCDSMIAKVCPVHSQDN